MARALNLSSRAPRLQSRGSRFHARLYERTGGRLGRRWFGVPVLVLETVGRRSGQTRSTPVVYLETDGGYLVTPANAGASRTPAWWLNLREAGEGVAVVRGRRQRVRPRELSGAEAERAWAAMQKALPAIDDYRTFTARRFPVVMLQPAD